MANVLISTPHPVTLEGQTRIECDLHPGESLFSFLHRHVADIGERPYTVLIGGVEIPMEYWTRVRPKHGQVIEAIGGAGRSALAMVAIVALSIWTGGAAAALAGGGSVFGLTGIAGYAAVLAVNVGAALLINKVLAPKMSDTSGQQAAAVSSLTGSQNRFRPNEPAGLLFGTARIAPDQLSKPYNYYDKDEMYLALHLSWGIGVDTIEDIYMGDTLLSDYSSDVTVWHNGFTGIADQQIPLFGNVDTIAGGQLQDGDGNRIAVERTTSLNTTRIQWDINIQLFDVTSKGKPKDNQERIDCYIRPAGSSNPWVLAGSQFIRSRTNKEHRFSIIATVPEGQYDTRTVRAGIDTGIENAQCRAALSTLTSVQKDEATYKGIARSGLQMRASSQLNSTPNEIRAVARSTPIPLWNGSEWVNVSTGNVGANMLKYLRGYYDENNNLIAGVGYSDDLIDIEAFKSFMVHCAAMGYEYNHWLQQDRDHITQLNTMAAAALAQYSDAGGLASVMWIADDQPEDAIVNMARIFKDDFQLDYSLVGTADGVVVKFVDATTWEDDELRIPMPGQMTMLNPATIEAEGVTDIDVAGMIGRYFLAQSLYQYKEISFGTMLEWLSYRRWSKIKLQFDMTQWGYGGVIVEATKQAGGNLQITVDEPVPYPNTGGGYIGIRVPGQRTYHVFPVEPFEGMSRVLTLQGEWPSSLAVPGDTPNNPAHDSIWIYDFKATPGMTARVTSITPKTGYTGASVSVVPESDEFWNYVINGIYVPSPNGSLLPTRPTANSLVITEERVLIDNVVQNQLTASYNIDGPCGHVVVTCDVDSPGFMKVVGETISGRTVTWVVNENRQYTITVRPYSPQGLAGVPATTQYMVGSVDMPPQLFDTFVVEDVGGGMRRYAWGYNSGETPVNVVGAEIRYVAGSVPSPNWETMTPLGGPGYHTAPFQAAVPNAGQWTFACRSRDSGDNLSTGMRVVTVTLTNSLSENLDDITREQQAQQQAIDQEILDRIAGDFAAVAEAVADARAYTDTQVAALNGILEDIVGADEWVAGRTYPKGDFVRHEGTMYRALAENTDVVPGSNPSVWQEIGDYTSVGDALAAAISMSTQNASDIAAESTRLDGVVVRMPPGTDQLARTAQVASEQQARIDGDNALGQRIDTVSVTAGDAQSTAAQAITAANNAASVAATAQTAAGDAQSTASQALTVANNASTAATQVSLQLGKGDNLFIDPGFAAPNAMAQGWGETAVSWQRNFNIQTFRPVGINVYGAQPAGSPVGWWSYLVPTKLTRVKPNTWYIGSIYYAAQRTVAGVDVIVYDETGTNSIQEVASELLEHSPADWSQPGAYRRASVKFKTGPGAFYAAVNGRAYGATSSDPYALFFWPQLEEATETQAGPTPYKEGAAGNAAATQALSVEVDSVDGRLKAKQTLTTDVNGNIAGYVSENDGTRSSFSILATVFRVLTGGAASGMEWQASYIRIYGSGYQLVMGTGFGSANNLVQWFGPNIGANNCTTANCIECKTTSGQTIIRGTMTGAGSLEITNTLITVKDANNVTRAKFGMWE